MAASESTMQVEHHLMPELFGEYDVFMKSIENEMKVNVVNRGDQILIRGAHDDVKLAEHVIEDLLVTIEKGVALTTSSVNYAIRTTLESKESQLSKVSSEYICVTPNGKYIRPKTVGQKTYMDTINEKMIVFGVGPAGTGKTYMAMAHAITAFKKNEVNRIILTRPAIEAGEKLGFLPGDLQSKVDPYLRPLYDALYEIMGADSFLANMEKGLIEVAPLAYMRGRTLDNAFIVLDEAQNTTPAQMKMFLTRIGYGSKAVITGDITQKDLPGGAKSGLDVATKILKNIKEIGVVRLTNKDVVRHPLVQKIVEAYEKNDNASHDGGRGNQRRDDREQHRPRGDYDDRGRGDNYSHRSHNDRRDNRDHQNRSDNRGGQDFRSSKENKFRYDDMNHGQGRNRQGAGKGNRGNAQRTNRENRGRGSRN